MSGKLNIRRKIVFTGRNRHQQTIAPHASLGKYDTTNVCSCRCLWESVPKHLMSMREKLKAQGVGEVGGGFKRLVDVFDS